MKHIVRVCLFNIFALWMTTQLIPALSVSGTWMNIVIAGLILSILMLIVKPLLKILFIPVNILTFGLLSWVINVIVLYLLTVLAPEVNVAPWSFPGLTYGGFALPPARFSYIVTLILVSFSVSAIGTVLHKISED